MLHVLKGDVIPEFSHHAHNWFREVKFNILHCMFHDSK
jgi:hypothetical protein